MKPPPPLSVKRPPSSGKQLCYLFTAQRRSHFHGERGGRLVATSPASRGLFASRSARLNVAFWCGAQLLLLPDCQRHTEGSCWRKWQSGHPSPPFLSLIIELVIWKSPQARPSVGFWRGEDCFSTPALIDQTCRTHIVNGNLILHGCRILFDQPTNILAVLPRKGNFVQVTRVPQLMTREMH